MKTQPFLMATLLLACAGGSLRSHSGSDAPPYSGLYVFGDSWSGTTDGPHWSSRVLTNALGWSNLIVRMTRNLSNSVVQLHEKGARTVMVAELDRFYRAPGFPTLTDTQATQVDEQVQTFNRALADTLSALDASIPNLRLLRLDFYDRWNEFLDQAVSMGFTKVDTGAVADPALADKSYTGPGSDYVFWDPYHPTSRTHGVWAEWFGEVAMQTRTESLRLVARSDSFDLELTKLKPGRGYALEASNDLLEWAVLESFTTVEGTNTLTIVPSPGDPAMRLFRLWWSE